MNGTEGSLDEIETANRNSIQIPPIASSLEKPKLNLLRVIAAVLLLAIGVTIMAVTSSNGVKANTDFITYWSAGQQLIHHGNPYDAGKILAIEQSAGYKASRPEFMRNMPTAFFMAYPLGFLGERAGSIVWSMLILGALMMSIRMLWIMHGRRADGIKLLGYCFPPALACLICGQIAVFLLFGMVLFLYFHRDRPVTAGFGLFLCALKPHLFVPFGVAFLMWSVARRQYRALASAASFLSASAAFALWMDPHAWAQYSAMMKSQHLVGEFIPTISLFFRLFIDRHLFWMQFVPVAAGACWAVWYFMRNRAKWDWRKQGLVLLLVSVLVAPYAWFMDETVVLPAIMAGLYCVSSAKRSMMPFWCIAGIAFLEVIGGIAPNSGYYVWTSTAWLLWFLHTQKSTRNPVAS